MNADSPSRPRPEGLSGSEAPADSDTSVVGSPLNPTPQPRDQSEPVRSRYARLLHTAVFHPDPLEVESALATAADLGREWLRQGIPPEEVTDIHHEALMTLAREHPKLALGDVAEYLTAPLMEAYMAYSLAFREQLEQRAAALVNARLEQSRRLEAIGTLAAGIAHDFNNLLGSILGFAELLRDDFADDSRGARYCGKITLAGERARDLVRRMLTFARDLSDEPVPVDLHAAIQETLGLLQASLPVHLVVRYHSDLDSAWVLAAPSEIQQIVMNLCINAADAIGAGAGTIDIALALGLPPEPGSSPAGSGNSAQVHSADPTDSAVSATATISPGSTPPYWGGGPAHGGALQEAKRSRPAVRASVGKSVLYLQLTVSDTGEGMTDETLRRVFDPFFTTKAPGKGSGLGLSVVHGIVGKLGGLLDVQSTLGQGTRFIIWLPNLDRGRLE